MIAIIVFVIVFSLFMFFAACSFGRAPSSGRSQITTPINKSVDGFGGARGYDYSYSSHSGRGGKGPFPVGLRLERNKTDTHNAYAMEDENY